MRYQCLLINLPMSSGFVRNSERKRGMHLYFYFWRAGLMILRSWYFRCCSLPSRYSPVRYLESLLSCFFLVNALVLL